MLGTILGILGTPKGLLVLGGTIAILAGVWWFERKTYGDQQFDAGVLKERTKWLVDIATKPVKADSSRDSSYVKKEREHLEGNATIDMPPPMHRPARSPAPDVCIDIARERDSLQGMADAASVPTHATLFDSGGGIHRLTYDPLVRKFFEDFIPAPMLEIHERIRERQEIPLASERRWWGMLIPAYAGGPAMAGIIGYQNVGIGYGRFGSENVYMLGLSFDL